LFKTIAIVVVVAIAAILVYATTLPDDFRVQRTTSIKAPPERSFPSSTISIVGVPGRHGRKWIPK
jgi:hypothetical protein